MEDIFVGYRYFDSFGVEPLYPFGYGLSYGKPEYELVEIAADWKEVTLKVKVKNVGPIRSRFVAQVYMSPPNGKLCKPYQELKAYGKTKALAAGEAEELTLRIPTESMASMIWNRSIYHGAGDYLIRLGRCSKNTAWRHYFA